MSGPAGEFLLEFGGFNARGTVLSKDELLRRIWPDRLVEENSHAVIVTPLGRLSFQETFGIDVS